jgi:hypothetical protein
MSMSDTDFIDSVAVRAKQMIVQLRGGVPMEDGLTPLQSASDFLSERFDDPPANLTQLGVVLATFIAVHLLRMTVPERRRFALTLSLDPVGQEVWQRRKGGRGMSGENHENGEQGWQPPPDDPDRQPWYDLQHAMERLGYPASRRIRP